MLVFVSTGLKTCLREWPRWRSASGFLSLFKMFHHVEELFPLLLKTLSDPSDEVSRRPLHDDRRRISIWWNSGDVPYHCLVCVGLSTLLIITLCRVKLSRLIQKFCGICEQ